MHLSVMFSNLGHIVRPQQPKRKEEKNELLFAFWGQNWAHIIASCEAESVADLADTIYTKFGLIGAHSEVEPDLCVYVRGHPGNAEVKLVQELANQEIHGASFTVRFGIDPQHRVSGQRSRWVQRASMGEVTIAVFHLHHDAANKRMGVAKARFGEFLQLCIDSRVDVLCGDANQAAYKYYNHQTFRDIPNSMVVRLVRDMVESVNKDLAYPQRLSMNFMTNNHEENFRTDDPDCCVTFVFGWGKATAARTTRKLLLQGIEARSRFITRKEWHDALAKELEKAVDSFPKDQARIKAIEYLLRPERNDNLDAPSDFHTTQSMRVLQTTREDLWLRGTDCSWHLPILITLREWAFKNWRKRTQYAEAKRIETSKSYLLSRKRGLSSGPEVSRERSGWSSGSWQHYDWQEQPWVPRQEVEWSSRDERQWYDQPWTGASSSAPAPQGGSEWSSDADYWLWHS